MMKTQFHNVRSGRCGIAPLEVVIVLPLLVTLFALIFFLSSACRQHIEHIFDTRNAAWKQRYDEDAGRKSNTFAFTANNSRHVADQYISENSSRTIKTGTIFDKSQSLTTSVAHATVLTGNTWHLPTNNSTGNPNALPNYRKKPFVQIPLNLGNEIVGSYTSLPDDIANMFNNFSNLLNGQAIGKILERILVDLIKDSLMSSLLSLSGSGLDNVGSSLFDGVGSLESQLKPLESLRQLLKSTY